MFFILSKILSFLIKPTFWILLLIISSIIFKSKRKRLLYISLFAFWFFGNGYIVDIAYRMWEDDAISVLELEKTYDYGIVLGGFSGYDNKKDRIEFNDCGDRLFYAIQLYKKGIIKKILVSGGNGQLINKEYLEADWSGRFLLEVGIPKEDILIENKSRNTYENAKYTSELLGDNTENLLLITSAWHMKRSNFCFQKFNLNCDKFPTDYTMKDKEFNLTYMILPTAQTYDRWETLIKEWVGFVVYTIKF